MTRGLDLALLPVRLAVWRLPPGAPLPPPPEVATTDGTLWSLTLRGAERSVVCDERLAPEAAAGPEAGAVERGWRALAVDGPLDFALVGVLASLAAPLAAADVPIFVLSTYETDLLLVREGALERALETLAAAGHRVRGAGRGPDPTR